MKKAILALLTLAGLAATPLAVADTSLRYPDGNAAFAFDLDGGVAYAFWNQPGAGDIYTLHTTQNAGPLDASLSGVEPGRGYWLDYQGQTFEGDLLFDVYAYIDGDWYYIQQYAL
jgi:hypothetical protein